MALDYEYGINIGNRFFDLTGHDEDPDEFIANQSNVEEKPKQSTKEAKTTTKKSSSKNSPATATAAPSTTTTTTTTVVAIKTNKENVTPRSADAEKHQSRSKPETDNDVQKEQTTRIHSSRGGRSFRRGGGSSGRGRPPYEGSNRGRGQHRSDRTNQYPGSSPRTNVDDSELSANTWSNEADYDNQQSRNYSYRGRGRGSGRSRGRGRGNFHSRPQEVTSQDQQPPNSSDFEQTVESNFDNVQPESIQPVAQDFDVDVTTPQKYFTEADGGRGRGRGHYGPRVFRNSRNYPADRENQREDYQKNYRQNRRQHDREQRSFNSTIKPVEKKGGEGANNWGNPVKIPENIEPTADTAEVADQPSEEAPATVSKDWAKQVDEAEEMMTLDEYKKKKEAQKQAQQEKILPLQRREANDGAVVKEWQDPKLRYRKKNDDQVSVEHEEHEDTDKEGEAEEESTEDNAGKKKTN